MQMITKKRRGSEPSRSIEEVDIHYQTDVKKNFGGSPSGGVAKSKLKQ
jgi:hypothetical protein